MSMTTTHEAQARLIPRRVTLFSSAAVKRGTAVCYAFDRTTTTTGETINDPWGGRDDGVELPDASNSHRFAGVLAQDYAAPANGASDQIICIYEPGSTCQVAVGAGVAGTGLQTLGDVLSFHQQAAGQGRFALSGSPGVGSCQVLQTLAVKTAAGQEQCYSGIVDGPAGGATLTSATKTLTDSGQFTAALAEVGDNVVILGGVDSAATAVWAGLGDYTIASRASDNNSIVLNADTGAGANGTNVAYYCFTGNPTVLAYLYPHGHQSGGTEYYVLQNAAETVAASMVGRTHLSGVDGANAQVVSLPSFTTVANVMKSTLTHGAIGGGGTVKLTPTNTEMYNSSGLAVTSITIEADNAFTESMLNGLKYCLLAASGTVA